MEQPDHVMIVERVVGHSSGTPDANKTGRPEEPELMRNGGLGQSDQFREITDAALAVTEHVHDPNASGISKQPEDVCHRFNSPRREQPRPEDRQGMRVVLVLGIAGVSGGRNGRSQGGSHVL
jgi:hypothetical protein